jgi:hypothetical protein
MRKRWFMPTLLALMVASACGGGSGANSGEAVKAIAVDSDGAVDVAAAADTVAPLAVGAVAPAVDTGGAGTAQAAPIPSSGGALLGRVIVGYQGWFGCPGDFDGNQDWAHWFAGAATPASLTIDMLPSVSGLADADLCDTGLRRSDGTPVRVFSSQSANVVGQHFEWMRDHGIDGAALQRFVSRTRDPLLRKRDDNVLANVMRSAERSGRQFYITYDISGDREDAADAIRRDWRYITSTLGVTNSPAYLRDRGKPVVQLWGFGFSDRPGSADSARGLITDFRNGEIGEAAVVIGGVPSRWRTLGADSKTDSAWAGVYRLYDVLSPWTVGRFATESEADNFARDVIAPDREETRRIGIGYLPVVFPGFSWHNLMATRGVTAPINQAPRDCGRFLWRQVVNAFPDGSLFAAMFDEVDEGTALFKLDERPAPGPAGTPMVSLDADGCHLPQDWYLRIIGSAAQHLRTLTLPPASLQEVVL